MAGHQQQPSIPSLGASAARQPPLMTRRVRNEFFAFHLARSTEAREAVLSALPPVDKVESRELYLSLCESTKTYVPPSFASAGARSGYISARLESRSSHIGSLLVGKPALDVLVEDLRVRAERSGRLRLAAFGGGPGFEAIGLGIVASYRGFESPVESVVFDNEPGWREAVEAVDRWGRESGMLRSCTFSHFDILSDETKSTALLQGDNIVMFSYVLVENASHLRSSGWGLLRHLLHREATAGTVFLFLDSTSRLWPEVAELIESGDADYERCCVRCLRCRWVLVMRCLRARTEDAVQARVLPSQSEAEWDELMAQFARADTAATRRRERLQNTESVEPHSDGDIFTGLSFGVSDPAVPAPPRSPSLSELRREVKLRFDTQRWDLRSAVRAVLGVAPSVPLHLLHTLPEVTEFSARGVSGPRGNPMNRAWQHARQIKSPAWIHFIDLFERFVREFVGIHVGCGEIVYQRFPTLRVQFPSPKPYGKRHCDADYHHPSSEINFWIALSDGLSEANTLWAESEPGLGDFHPFALCYGECVRFWANRCQHYAVPNSSEFTRVSLDVRVISEASGGLSENDSERFVAGRYYAVVPTSTR